MAQPLNPTHSPPPHWHSREVLRHVNFMMLATLLPVVAAGAMFFGMGILMHIGVAIICALLCNLLVCALVERSTGLMNGHTVLLATVLALTLPPDCGAGVVALGAALMVAAREIFGGVGHYLWHPVLIARVILCFAFSSAMVPDQWPVLKRGQLFTGQIQLNEVMPANNGWLHATGSPDRHAWISVRPDRLLASLYRPPENGRSADEALVRLVRDDLPPTSDCLLGTTGGSPGETSIVAILLGGLFLIYRGYVHWTLPLGAVLGLMLTAAMLPIATADGAVLWWPIRLRWYVSGQPSLPVGLLLVLYHLLTGGFLFTVFFVASDLTASPLRSRGHLLYGAGVGVLTIVLRSAGFVPGACYWAVLMMNTFTPLIDRLTRPRVYGS